MTRLDQIRQRVERATKGPWTWSGGHTEDPGVGFFVHPDLASEATWDDFSGGYREGISMANADFIAHSRVDLPALLAVVEAANRYIEEGFGSGEHSNLKALSDALAPLLQQTEKDE